MSNTAIIFNLYFKLKVYQLSGSEFQTFFSKIMFFLDPNFVSIKPHGNWGDGGNDGYNPNEKHYYQIYAPLASTNLNALQEFNKAVTDYQKLVQKWGNVQGYSFVMNDRFTHTQAHLQKNFQQFLQDNNIAVGSVIGALHLQRLFNKLDQQEQMDVLDMYCIDENSNVDFEPSEIGELIRHLVNTPDMNISFLTAKAPDFDEKIVFNQLNSSLATRIKSNFLEVHKIDDFLSFQDDDLSQALSKTVNDFYRKIADTIPVDEIDRNELIYLGLIDAIVPSYAKGNLTKRGYNTVAEIIISKYFETCDVYEDPNSSVTT